MQKFAIIFVANLASKIRKEFSQVSFDENYYQNFFQIFSINYLPEKAKKKLKNSPLLV